MNSGTTSCHEHPQQCIGGDNLRHAGRGIRQCTYRRPPPFSWSLACWLALAGVPHIADGHKGPTYSLQVLLFFRAYNFSNQEHLDLGSDNPSESAIEMREDYAKMALLVFHPFQQLNDLKYKDSYWRKLDRECEKHFNENNSKFWTKGFDFLQNIQDKVTLEKKIVCAKDPIAISTKCKRTSRPENWRKSNQGFYWYLRYYTLFFTEPVSCNDDLFKEQTMRKLSTFWKSSSNFRTH